MRDLTEDEIREYFQFAKTDRGGFSQEQADLIAEHAVRAKYFSSIAIKMLGGLADGLDVEQLMLSLWVSGFQMGRECESRLLTLALKKSFKEKACR